MIDQDPNLVMDRGSEGLVVGLRFNPTDLELVQHYLPRRIAVGNGFHSDFIHECPGFFGEKPWDVWHKYGGGQCNREEDVKAIYVFTHRKRLSPNSTRFNRKVGAVGGTWRGQYPRPILNYDDVLVGKRREFQFRYDNNPTKDVWLMEEYEVGDDSDTVLCALRKKPTPPPSHCSPAVSNTRVNKRKLDVDHESEPKRHRKEEHTCGVQEQQQAPSSSSVDEQITLELDPLMPETCYNPELDPEQFFNDLPELDQHHPMMQISNLDEFLATLI